MRKGPLHDKNIRYWWYFVVSYAFTYIFLFVFVITNFGTDLFMSDHVRDFFWALWFKHPVLYETLKNPLAGNILWSLFFLVPIFFILAYGFLPIIMVMRLPFRFRENDRPAPLCQRLALLFKRHGWTLVAREQEDDFLPKDNMLLLIMFIGLPALIALIAPWMLMSAIYTILWAVFFASIIKKKFKKQHPDYILISSRLWIFLIPAVVLSNIIALKLSAVTLYPFASSLTVMPPLFTGGFVGLTVFFSGLLGSILVGWVVACVFLPESSSKKVLPISWEGIQNTIVLPVTLYACMLILLGVMGYYYKVA